MARKICGGVVALSAAGAAAASPTHCTRADSVAKFTAASATPGTFFKARSTRATHEAQLMPSMPISKAAGKGACMGGVFSVIYKL